MIKIIINPEQHDLRLDIALSQSSDISRHHIKQLIDAGFVSLNGKTILKSSYKVTTEQEFVINLDGYKENQKCPNSGISNIEILYEDEYIAIINKAAGQVVHPSPGHSENTLSQQLEVYFQNNLSTFSNRAGIVHRLDKDTSGLMIIAKTDQAHNILQNAFANRIITKGYISKPHNLEKLPEHFWLEGKIGPHPTKHQLMAVFNQKTLLTHEKIKHIEFKHTEFDYKTPTINIIDKKTTAPEPIEGDKTQYKYALLECVKHQDYLICYPHTGRQHQIRVQLKQLGHAIIGDPFYSKIPAERMMLHACLLRFSHPILDKEITIIQPAKF